MLRKKLIKAYWALIRELLFELGCYDKEEKKLKFEIHNAIMNDFGYFNMDDLNEQQIIELIRTIRLYSMERYHLEIGYKDVMLRYISLEEYLKIMQNDKKN